MNVTVAYAFGEAHFARLRELLDDQRARRWKSAQYRGHILELAGSTVGILARCDLERGH